MLYIIWVQTFVNLVFKYDRVLSYSGDYSKFRCKYATNLVTCEISTCVV